MTLKHATDISRKAAESIMQDSVTSQTACSAKPLPKSWGMELYRRFRSLYGAKFTDNFSGEADIEQWATIWTNALAGINGDQIRFALNRCAVERGWPPAPSEFIALCSPDHAELGLPSPDAAWVILCNAARHGSLSDRWNHPVVFHAARDRQLDLFNLRNLPAKQGMAIWGPVYAEYVKRFAAGEEFAFPENKAIENQIGKAVTPEEKKALKETAAKAIQAMKMRISRRYVDAWQEVNGMRVYA